MNVTSLMHLTVAILGSLIVPMRFLHVHRQRTRFDADICCYFFPPHKNSVIALVVKLKTFYHFSRLSLYFPDFFRV